MFEKLLPQLLRKESTALLLTIVATTVLWDAFWSNVKEVKQQNIELRLELVHVRREVADCNAARERTVDVVARLMDESNKLKTQLEQQALEIHKLKKRK